MVNWWWGYGQLEGVHVPVYMCILLYVKLIWCSGIPQVYGQLEVGKLILLFTSYEKISSLWNLFGVLVFHRSMVNWGGGMSALCIYAFCYMSN